MRKRQDTNHTLDPTLCQGLCKELLYYIPYKYSVSGIPTGRKLGLGEPEVTVGVDDRVEIGAQSRLTSVPPLVIQGVPDAHAQNPSFPA